MKRFTVYLQYLLPQHWLSRGVGRLANSRNKLIKKVFINTFIRLYRVDLSTAEIEDANQFVSFNDFFCRALKPKFKPNAISSDVILSPSEGQVAQIGVIKKDQLMQAKNMYFTLDSLLGNEKLARHFYDGQFTTIYLAPPNYHRVHMPVTGTLLQTIFIPGKLFSVNKMTSSMIPNLYARNERLIALFATDSGPMAVILVGAMIVGSISTVWKDMTCHPEKVMTETFPATGENAIRFEQGAELGRFKLGSTVIVLFGKDKVQWQAGFREDTVVKAGEVMGTLALSSCTHI